MTMHELHYDLATTTVAALTAERDAALAAAEAAVARR